MNRAFLEDLVLDFTMFGKMFPILKIQNFNKTMIHSTPGIALFKNSYKISLIQHFEAKAKTFGTRGYRYLLSTSTDGLW